MALQTLDNNADGSLSTFEKSERWHGEGSAHYA
jgi:hypothetical protein